MFYVLAVIFILFLFFIAKLAIKFASFLFPLKMNYFKKSLIYLIVYFCGLSPILFLFFPAGSKFRYLLKFLGNQLLAFGFILLFLIGIACIQYLILKIRKKTYTKKRAVVYFSIYSFIYIVLLTIGFVQGGKVYITPYTIESQLKNNLRIVMVTDLHLGVSSSVRDIKKFVETTNRQNPNLVLFGGDIFDNSYLDIKDIDGIGKELANLKATYGSYAVWGNHDFHEEVIYGLSKNPVHEMNEYDQKMVDFLKNSKITLLEDTTVEIKEGIWLAGRSDLSRTAKLGKTRKELNDLLGSIKKEEYTIVLDHQPLDYDIASALGVDVYLSGHTHNGQIFPLNFVTKAVWKDNPYGLKKHQDLQGIVSSGYGIWGPKFRLGTKKEIVLLDII